MLDNYFFGTSKNYFYLMTISSIEKDKKTPNTKNKLIGKHPKSNEDIIAAEGKYGPYIKYLKKNYSIPKDLSMEEIDLEIASTCCAF